MPRLSLALIPALLLATAPADAAMSVGAFLARAQPLRDQGIAAILNPDFQVLKGEADDATRQLRADRLARAAAGKPPIACVPDDQSIGIADMLDGLAALSLAERKLPLKDGYARVLAKRFPCR